MILAAGRGTRMGGLTADLPKPMLPVKGRPLLEHVLDRLRAAGIRRAFLVTGYRAETIERHFENYPLEIVFQRQERIDGTGSAALLARGFAGSDDFLLTFGDILAGAADYQRMMAILAEDPHAEAGVGARWVDDPWQGAAVYEENGRVVRIVEKPPRGASSTHWNSAGLYGFRPSVFEELALIQRSPRGEYELTSAVDAMITKGKRLVLCPMLEPWRDVGRPEDLDAAGAMIP